MAEFDDVLVAAIFETGHEGVDLPLPLEPELAHEATRCFQ